MGRPSSATINKLAERLRKRGIPLPQKQSKKDMEHRLAHWESSLGMMLHPIRVTNIPDHLQTPEGYQMGTVYWAPESNFMRELIATGQFEPRGYFNYEEFLTWVFEKKVSNNNGSAVVLDVPFGYTPGG